MSEEQQKQIDELLHWLEWTAAQKPGNETEILFQPGSQIGGVLINLN
jgi:hypothetical protein